MDGMLDHIWIIDLEIIISPGKHIMEFLHEFYVLFPGLFGQILGYFDQTYKTSKGALK
jgi:hypothetical protein